jgi:hypothetical protein
MLNILAYEQQKFEQLSLNVADKESAFLMESSHQNQEIKLHHV